MTQLREKTFDYLTPRLLVNGDDDRHAVVEPLEALEPVNQVNDSGANVPGPPSNPKRIW